MLLTVALLAHATDSESERDGSGIRLRRIGLAESGPECRIAIRRPPETVAELEGWLSVPDSNQLDFDVVPPTLDRNQLLCRAARLHTGAFMVHLQVRLDGRASRAGVGLRTEPERAVLLPSWWTAERVHQLGPVWFEDVEQVEGTLLFEPTTTDVPGSVVVGLVWSNAAAETFIYEMELSVDAPEPTRRD